jgi:RNA polymerase sigma-32 factor
LQNLHFFVKILLAPLVIQSKEENFMSERLRKTTKKPKPDRDLKGSEQLPLEEKESRVIPSPEESIPGLAEMVQEDSGDIDNGQGQSSAEDFGIILPAKEDLETASSLELAETSEKSVAPFDPLRRYLWEIKRYPVLSREDEHRLAIEYRRTGDRNIAMVLITSNLRLVVKIALEFQKHWMLSLMDLIQEGNVGLMQAMKKFDPYRGTRLSSYASFWIKAYILKFIIDNWRLVKIGTTQTQRKLFFNLKKEKERLGTMGFNPGPQLLAQRLDVKEREVIEMGQRLNGWELSLDIPVHEDSRTKHKDLLTAAAEPVDERLADLQLKEILQRKLKDFQDSLSERDRFIYQNRLTADQPVTLQEIGNRFGISRERARQIEERLKQRLKDYLKNEMPELAEFVDKGSI